MDSRKEKLIQASLCELRKDTSLPRLQKLMYEYILIHMQID